MIQLIHRLARMLQCSAVVACLCAVSLASGCAISKKECLQNDWQTRGYKDGKVGKSPDVLSSYAKTCGKHGVTPDPVAYKAGFDVGVIEYCTPENGFRTGRKNKDYESVCPVELERGFLNSYVSGLHSAFDNLSFSYDRHRFELDVLRDERNRLIADGQDPKEQNKDIKSLSSSLRQNIAERQQIKDKIRRWEASLAQ